MKRYLLLTIALFSTYAVMSQGYATSGLLFDHDIVSASSMASLSQRNYMGTARSMAMGGAFTSLGADMASLGINPAGFGMYQRNEVSITLGLGINKSKNYGATPSTSGNSNVNCSVNNVGGSFQIYEGTGSLLALNFAFGYNKVADYNYAFSFTTPSSTTSVAHTFADLANSNSLGINADNKICDSNGYYDYDMDPYFWTTALAYKGGLINRGASGWITDEIAPGAKFDQRTHLKSEGSAGEFSFALGGNISNIVYFGVSLDVQSISRKQILYYDEFIGYPEGTMPDATAYPYQLRNFELGQAMNINGTGIGAKFGVVVRPIKALRIGLAIHTPSYYSLSYRYNAALTSTAFSAGTNPDGYELSKDGYLYSDFRTPKLEDIGSSRWAFATPTRVLVGLSYTIGKYAIISADYEYDDFAGIRIKSAPIDYGFIDKALRNNFRGIHHIRAGIEAKPVSFLALRVGGGWTSRAIHTDYILPEPIMNSAWSVSAGLGFRISEITSIDIAYQYRNERNSDYYTYFSESNNGINASSLYGLDILRHNIAVTFAFRF